MLRQMALRRYGIAVVLILGCCIYVSHQDQKTRDQYEQKCSQLNASSVPRSGHHEDCDEGAENAARHLPPWYRIFGWPEGITTWAILLTLLVIANQTRETAKAAEATQIAVHTADKSLALQEDTAKRQLRAYMVMRNSRLIIHEDGFVEAKMELANCGQTPAYDLRGATLCRFTTYPIQRPKSMPNNLRQSQSTIGAGLAFHLLPPGGRHDKGNREQLLRKLSAEGGNLVYCVNGYFTYKDIFQDPHWIKFQMIVGGPGGVRVDADESNQWASFSNDCEGNEEDQKA